MFDISDDNIHQEVMAGEEATAAHLSKWAMNLQRYADRPKIIEGDGMAEHPENHTFEYLSYMAPKISYDNPRVSVRSRNQVATTVLTKLRRMLEQGVALGAVDQIQAQQMLDKINEINGHPVANEHFLNRWIRDSDYQSLLDRVVYDYILAYGISHSGIGTMPGHNPANPDSLRWPLSNRLSPTRYIQDPVCLHPDEAAWNGHWETVNKDSLKDRARFENEHRLTDVRGKWILDAIENMSPIGSVREGQSKTELDRKEVQLYHIWLRDYSESGWPGPDEGYHGALLTLGTIKGRDTHSEGTTRPVREPMPYFGPPWGPRVLFGAYVEPDNGLPLSPIMATSSQAEELNAHAKSMSHSAANYKRIILVSDRNPDLAQRIKDSPHDLVLSIEDELFDKDQVVALEIGGITDQQITYTGIAKDRLHRMSGMTDVQRGETDPDVSATADAIADSASEVRASYLQKKYAQCVTRDLATKVWYAHYEDRITVNLGPDAGEIMGMIQPVFRGGPKGDLSFFDLELEIDAYSMGRTNEALLQKRTLEAVNLVVVMAPLMAQFQYIDWKELVRRIGDAMNIPDLADVIDFDKLISMGAQMLESGQAQPAQQTSADGFQRQEMNARNASPGKSMGAMRGREAEEVRRVG